MEFRKEIVTNKNGAKRIVERVVIPKELRGIYILAKGGLPLNAKQADVIAPYMKYNNPIVEGE